MDEAFLKSALPNQGPFVVDDTTLALPSDTTSKPGGKVNSNDRSLRVQQQVQLTLARKGRKALPNGSVHSQRSTACSFDHSEGHLPVMKVNGLGLSNRSLSSKPCRRVEVTPPPSPGTPQRPLMFGFHSMGMYTVPGPAHLNRVTLDRSLSSDFYHRYAFSDGPRLMRPHRSSASYRQRAFRHVALPQPVFEDEVFYPNVEQSNSTRWSQRQTSIKQDHNSVGHGLNGTVPPESGSAWLSRVRGSTHALRRLNSYPPSTTSMEVDTTRPNGELTIRAGNVTALKSENRAPEMTIERAVSLLSQDNEETLLCAVSFIQNQCFKSADAKKMIYYLRGIGKLMELLGHDNEEVQHVAAGSLRNLVFQSDENKMEVKENNGLSTILRALKSSRDVETRRQLTGLLWNLSSHDLLKEHLSVDALPVLTQSVLVPSSGLSEGENPKDELLADEDVFHNATGCLRNLSSAGSNGRKAMRECENLIDSLVYYIRGTIADYKTDDKTTENCVCILHNLSYQIEEELPRMFAEELRQSRLNVAPKPKPVGCFPSRSAKITEQLERHCPLLEEKSNPCGVEWLWSSITVRMYLSLIARSVRHHTQEAALGALQNITAGHGPVTEAICFTIVQRENGLQHIKRPLEEGDSEVRRTAVSLIRNLSRHRELHPEIITHVLPEIVSMLPNNDRGTDQPSEVTTCLCHILLNLSQNQTDSVKAVVNQGALPKIINISSKDNGYGPSRAGQAACVLLHSMWKHTDLHSLYKKCGFRKADFINSRTTKVMNST
ncbi:plakophilin-2 isoform X1 [Periophthalmus magnuspinnatus]|uniref:plakophilin-2 isoform X1 n=1 Tax=Periophthalmus magnuspinnatus TaxID=409849 RepID=UPI00145B8734|nr:plakophilin-2 isoform X1 [Periophthalmus magnuspinnatus]